MKNLKLAAALAALALTAPAAAQVPPDIAEKTRALGAMMDPAIGYSPWVGRFDPSYWNGMTVTRGIAYGSDSAQVLDVYLPDGAAEDDARRPVLLFVHGGGFRGGRREGMPYPDNIPGWAVHEGMIGVSIDYRLAPLSSWPAGSEDLKSALAWVREHIAGYGGDPDRIVLFGHSAGANHVADYVGHNEFHGSELAGVKGAVLLSPFYAPQADPAQPHVYYGADEALQTAVPQVERLRMSHVPLFIGVAQYDIEPMRTFGLNARDWLCEQPERCPEFIDLPDHNHFTEGLSLGSEDKTLATALVAWLKLNGIISPRPQ
ncbi:carboxylesterase family protein [Altererythrobacter salegens]|uniref:Carboxylesterase family protein n=1 Tax=Croceibacterium salegens TaxID=1737568 RepID=A0A6I4ST48_9SPHN|nr:carboxylesterase family protein [Croceibacterium salegens]MXO59065.1 carboxylesterase family protein [Croceibacterium salegens]